MEKINFKYFGLSKFTHYLIQTYCMINLKYVKIDNLYKDIYSDIEELIVKILDGKLSTY